MAHQSHNTRMVTGPSPLLLVEIERNLYCVLAMTLSKDPYVAIKVMAFWLWLERLGFNGFIRGILDLSASLTNRIADEAIMYLQYLNTHAFSSSVEYIQLPLTRMQLGEEKLASYFFFRNRDFALSGIADTIKELHTNVLGDLLEEAIQRNNARFLVDTQNTISALIRPEGSSRTNTNFRGTDIARGNLRSNTVSRVVGPHERSLFATFSRGHPLSEDEIYGFLNSIYGDCIEAIYMEDKLGRLPECARIVFHSVDVMHNVLNGVELVKYMVNGKHLWMRKFKPKPENRIPPAS